MPSNDAARWAGWRRRGGSCERRAVPWPGRWPRQSWVLPQGQEVGWQGLEHGSCWGGLQPRPRCTFACWQGLRGRRPALWALLRALLALLWPTTGDCLHPPSAGVLALDATGGASQELHKRLQQALAVVKRLEAEREALLGEQQVGAVGVR